jgi:hypothetical protein
MNLPNILKHAIKQIRSSWLLLLWIYVPCFLLFLGIGILAISIPHFRIGDILKDVATLGKIPFYSGAVSQLGLLLWSATTTLCFFTYFALRKTSPIRRESLNLLLFAGLLTGYLTLDDTYMLHEEFFPDYLKIIPEEVVIFMLGIAMLSFLYFNLNEILQSEYSLILLAYLFFGISVIVDVIPAHLYQNIYGFEKILSLLEDGAKFTAIITWVTFYSRYCYQQFLLLQRPHFDNPGTSSDPREPLRHPK